MAYTKSASKASTHSCVMSVADVQPWETELKLSALFFISHSSVIYSMTKHSVRRPWTNQQIPKFKYHNIQKKTNLLGWFCNHIFCAAVVELPNSELHGGSRHHSFVTAAARRQGGSLSSNRWYMPGHLCGICMITDKQLKTPHCNELPFFLFLCLFVYFQVVHDFTENGGQVLEMNSVDQMGRKT